MKRMRPGIRRHDVDRSSPNVFAFELYIGTHLVDVFFRNAFVFFVGEKNFFFPRVEETDPFWPDCCKN